MPNYIPPRESNGTFSGSIIKRLEHQMMAKGVPNARKEAVTHLQKTGVLRPGTEMLTAKGKVREGLGAEGRALSRAAKASGHKPSDYVYRDGAARLRVR